MESELELSELAISICRTLRDCFLNNSDISEIKCPSTGRVLNVVEQASPPAKYVLAYGIRYVASSADSVNIIDCDSAQLIARVDTSEMKSYYETNYGKLRFGATEQQ